MLTWSILLNFAIRLHLMPGMSSRSATIRNSHTDHLQGLMLGKLVRYRKDFRVVQRPWKKKGSAQN